MTNHPHPTPPLFVPAVPITVLSYRKGECLMAVAGRVVTGATLREALACLNDRTCKEPAP